jgi:hypothetical protein
MIGYRLALANRGTAGLGTVVISDVLGTVGVNRSNPTPLKYVETLNGAGSIEFEVPADHASVTTATFSEGKELHLYRDDGGGEDLWWGGHLWIADVTWPFIRFIGYGWFYDLTRRCAANRIDRAVYDGVDQFDIVRDLVDKTQAEDPIGITHFNLTDSGVLKDLEICEEERKHVGDAITDFAAEEDGLDFEISAAKVLRLWYPRRGSVQAITFDAASNVSQFSYQKDGTTINTQVAAVGEDECGPYVEYFEDAPGLAAYGLLNGSVEDGGRKKARVRQKAKELLRTTKTPRFQPEIVTLTDLPGSPDIATYAVGDVVTVEASQGPAGGFGNFSGLFRILEREVSVSKLGLETVSLTVDSVVT